MNHYLHLLNNQKCGDIFWDAWDDNLNSSEKKIWIFFWQTGWCLICLLVCVQVCRIISSAFLYDDHHHHHHHHRNRNRKNRPQKCCCGPNHLISGRFLNEYILKALIKHWSSTAVRVSLTSWFHISDLFEVLLPISLSSLVSMETLFLSSFSVI